MAMAARIPMMAMTIINSISRRIDMRGNRKVVGNSCGNTRSVGFGLSTETLVTIRDKGKTFVVRFSHFAKHVEPS
jgi:hypothetical protein